MILIEIKGVDRQNRQEFETLENNRTWTLVPATPDITIVNNRWIFRVKHNADGSVDRYKARLVAKGFQQIAGLHFFETYSPVIKPCTIRVIFTLVVNFGWGVQQTDVNNAFLNAELQETVYMHQP
ncbi:uncharacterized mitochondrial protein AtMg00820-like [Humulus lupulus]|uniref:uncharacterized mitochondrial protein AtMg00820-like n=1 Tax=Humulus lupulus TaxID=3486 RepID=UPI002B410492|nr:uncharacterized mitochondrial protein AtMg00820-like [Humulus lupulus]